MKIEQLIWNAKNGWRETQTSSKGIRPQLVLFLANQVH
jgi:hypothetical protein